jgi:hypothetical protein
LLVGSWWSRAHRHEIDLVGVSDARPPQRVEFVGSIKWRERGAFDDADARALVRDAAEVPGVDARTLHIAVSRSGFSTSALDARLGPEDLLASPAPGLA